MAKHKIQKRSGRKPIDEVGSARSLERALDASLEKRGQKMETWRRAITRDYERSKHFQGKAKQ
jgi:hypothetical protein